ncbi:MAG TPA: class I SAM-dependent methyltransferase [Amaricoccus sp.]|uniref:class I SAM-dependent methyltransferase n=1 Tax=Amaricoccus sp. TaxID=1872485 RepID=UPI002BF72DB5|nr:class I SAM-dependent methyltransferase [Amaricoccus sp.]HMQ94697.1 class I SAM-dependent methyltransferase [Amaricoccus sp.]HMR52067.1 class I SAM-dependent methyltransferase [Amaricoccus sp.]HMR62137.1 class I SAM-dependent methyltransferase [Amaricoccus sp.]HMT98869.1 class I SAM-dependent methyltransferase [Amaricoccus sp.]
MSDQSRHDAWAAGESYDAYMGRWSRQIAPRFLDWLDAEPGLDWLEVGCGTGALSGAILAQAAPRSLQAIDPSEGFVARAREIHADARAEFAVGDARALAAANASRDVIVSGLVLNFVPDRPRALAEMARVARPNGRVGFYVWDYPGGGIGFMRAFWTAAAALDPEARMLAEDVRFPFCTPEALVGLAREAGLAAVEATEIAVPTVFRDFADYWTPFTLGAGPAPGYCAGLAPSARERLRERLEAALPRQSDGSIRLAARAWAIRGRAA